MVAPPARGVVLVLQDLGGPVAVLPLRLGVLDAPPLVVDAPPLPRQVAGRHQRKTA